MRRWALIFMIVTFTGIGLCAAARQDDAACTVTASSTVNRRSGPGTDYDPMGKLEGGQTAEVTGQIMGQDGFVWWQLADGAWVRADVVQAAGACEQVPVVELMSVEEAQAALDAGYARLDADDIAGAFEQFQAALVGFKGAGDRAGEAKALTALGAAYHAQGDYYTAQEQYWVALPVARSAGDRAVESRVLHQIGRSYHAMWLAGSQGRDADALDYYNQALQIAQRAQDRAGEADTRYWMGVIYDDRRVLDDSFRSEEFLNAALAIYRELGDRAGEAQTLQSLGWMYDHWGHYAPALDHFQQALAIHETLDRPEDLAHTHEGLGAFYLHAENYALALRHLLAAQTLYRSLDDQAGEGRALVGIGAVRAQFGYYVDALLAWRDAMAILQAVGDPENEALALNGMGDLFLKLGHTDQAYIAYDRALTISIDAGDPKMQAVALGNLGHIYLNLFRTHEAEDQYLFALDIQRETLALPDLCGERDTLADMGWRLSGRGEHEEAMNYLIEAQKVAQRMTDVSGEAMALLDIGAAYMGRSLHTLALQSYQQALELFRSAGNRAGEAAALSDIGLVYHRLGQQGDALSYYTQALAIHRDLWEAGDAAAAARLVDRSGEARTLGRMGMAYYTQGQHAEALRHLQMALDIYTGSRDFKAEIETLNNAGRVYRELGEYTKAVEYHYQALGIAVTPFVEDLAWMAGRLEAAYDDLSFESRQDIQKLIGIASGPRDIVQAAGISIRGIDQTLADQVTLLAGVTGADDPALNLLLGDVAAPERFRDVGEQVVPYLGDWLDLEYLFRDIKDKGYFMATREYVWPYLQTLAGVPDPLRGTLMGPYQKDLTGVADTLQAIGAIYAVQGLNAEAAANFERALQIHIDLQDREGQSRVMDSLVNAYLAQGNYGGVRTYAWESQKLHHEMGDVVGEAIALTNIGVGYRDNGQFLEAERFHLQALGMVEELDDRSSQARILADLGALYEAWGKPDRAIEYYKEAVDVIEAIHADIRLEGAQTAFGAQHTATYDRLVRLLAAAGDPTAAFTYTERGRARTFLFQLANQQLEFGAGAGAEYLAQWQQTRDRLAALRINRLELQSRLPPSPEAIQEIDALIDEAERELAQLEDLIALQNPALGQVTGVDVPDLAAIQAAIPADTTLLAYYITDAGVLAFVLTPGGLEAVPLPPAPDDLRATVAAFRADERQTAPLEQLYAWLVEPLAGKLGTANLLIAPHGVLNYIPFAALIDGSGQCLGAEFVISYTPSATVYTVLAGTRAAPVRAGSAAALVIGNPRSEEMRLRSLVFAEAEARAVGGILHTEAALSADATETYLRARIGAASVIHLAVHGVFDKVNPLTSFLALAPDDANDGFLEVREVYALPLREHAPLVVLSACQTAVGELRAGDEFQGLTRAFLLSGSRAVVASLWSVDDEATAALMEAFYTNRAAGMGDAAALAAAQRAVREDAANPQWTSPYYWAAFVLVGVAG
ncbi:MAG: tetratricopeptide repeat protein [Anaerolineae bacterium]|nr:tetratricopeptide repeat protein [Anaerolineae bacterium]